MPEQTLSAISKLKNAVQLAGFHYIVCIKMRPTNADHEIKFYDQAYSFESIRNSDSKALHAEFQQWSGNTVIRDLLENFSIFLMEFYREAIQLNPSRTFTSSLNQFERKGLEDQLKTIQLDFNIDERWITRLLSFNKARNCLAHRNGIVGNKDVTNGNCLALRWLKTEIQKGDGVVKPLTEITGPMNGLLQAEQIMGNIPIDIYSSEKIKYFSVGSSLIFEPTDILDICLNIHMAGFAISLLQERQGP